MTSAPTQPPGHVTDGSRPTPRYSAADIAAALRRPSPTPEQTEVIEAPLEPAVVIAGAGSGKTETMASRVVWLVVNGLVPAEQVLGLTFTRKAARELAMRVRQRLHQVRRVLGQSGGQPRGNGQVRSEMVGDEVIGEVTVSTYDAYAQRLVTEHGLRLGHEPGARLITEAVAWQCAYRVVEAFDGPMDHVDAAMGTVVRAVLSLHDELAGHLATTDQVESFSDRLRETIMARPRGPRQRTATDLYADVRGLLERQAARVQLLPIVRAFAAEKGRREVVDFADQAALAARLARDFPEVGRSERERYSVVLLDEYQDTSHAQLVMLSGLFGHGHAVTAVGDPCQSIYGWRGASAATLTAFSRQFPTSTAEPASIYYLRRSFRNASRILAVANALSTQLRAGGLDVPELEPAPDAGPGTVVCNLHLTADDEAVDIAVRARDEWDRGGREGRTISIAVLVRKRSQIRRIAHELRAAGLPVEVVGVGGLLDVPEVADVVATLRVLSDPTRGDALMRLLTGARWQLGPRDIAALGRWARRLSGQPAGTAQPPVQDEAGTLETDDVDGTSLIDALDAIPPPGWLSPEGHRRAERLARELRGLRTRYAQPLPDLVADVVHTLGLNVEVVARDGPSGPGSADLDAFHRVATDFASSGEDASVPAFLAYLDAAEAEERGLQPGEVEVDERRVQVLTVHGAKGLEWDVVFLAGLSEGVFPAAGDRDRAWLTDLGALPFPLRGDQAVLPVFNVADAADQTEVRDAVERFVDECGDRARLEERRLAYVGVTRARSLLVCSGYRWDEATKPREPAEYLREIHALDRAVRRVDLWAAAPGATNPLTAEQHTHPWPYDLLSPIRRAELAAGAALVDAAMAGELPLSDEAVAEMQRWERDVDLLLAERARTAAGNEVEVPLPAHVSVSQLVQLRRDPVRLARTIRRPLPLPPAPFARRGTAFHGWLEARWGSPHLLDVDELPGSADENAASDAELSQLQEAFERSEWAERTPVEIESAFEITLAGVAVRGRVDAVFATPDGGLDVVDWKTGRVPTDPEDRASRAVQLAVYRLAFSRLREVPLDRVRAAFHFVRQGRTLRPVDLLDESGLVALIRSIPARG